MTTTTNPATKPPTFSSTRTAQVVPPPQEPESWAACRRLWETFGTVLPTPPSQQPPSSKRWIREPDILRALAEVLTECRDGADIFDAAHEWLKNGNLHVPDGQGFTDAEELAAFQLENDPVDTEIPEPSPGHLADQKLVLELIRRTAPLAKTSWEEGFIESARVKVFEQGHRLSQKQIRKIEELLIKYPEVS